MEFQYYATVYIYDLSRYFNFTALERSDKIYSFKLDAKIEEKLLHGVLFASIYHAEMNFECKFRIKYI